MDVAGQWFGSSTYSSWISRAFTVIVLASTGSRESLIMAPAGFSPNVASSDRKVRAFSATQRKFYDAAIRIPHDVAVEAVRGSGGQVHRTGPLHPTLPGRASQDDARSNRRWMDSSPFDRRRCGEAWRGLVAQPVY